MRGRSALGARGVCDVADVTCAARRSSEQVHVHAVLPTFDVTDAALPLQCVAVVH